MAISPSLSLAQSGIQTPPEPAVKNVQDVIRIIETLINYLFTGLILLATVMTLYAAYLYLTAGGSEENINKAKSVIIFAAVGVAVALLSRAVVFIVKSIL